MPKRLIVDIEKRRRGRPPVDATPIMVRMPPGELAALDNWIERQKNAPSRPRSIRRLVEQALASASPARRDKEAAAKAAEMAEQEIERIEDKAATVEERTRRKRRLIEGPREFREMRSDRPARKTTK